MYDPTDYVKDYASITFSHQVHHYRYPLIPNYNIRQKVGGPIRDNLRIKDSGLCTKVSLIKRFHCSSPWKWIGHILLLFIPQTIFFLTFMALKINVHSGSLTGLIYFAHTIITTTFFFPSLISLPQNLFWLLAHADSSKAMILSMASYSSM